MAEQGGPWTPCRERRVCRRRIGDDVVAIIERLHRAGWSISGVPLRGEGDGSDQTKSLARVIVRP